MTVYYADSSALAKRYVSEVGSSWVQSACGSASDNVIALANVGLAEIAAALGVKHRQGHLSGEVRDALLLDLQRDARDQYWLVDVGQDIVLEAIALTRSHKLRGYDAVHLACALFLQRTLTDQGLPGIVLLSADSDLLAAGRARGLPTENPLDHQ